MQFERGQSFARMHALYKCMSLSVTEQTAEGFVTAVTHLCPWSHAALPFMLYTDACPFLVLNRTQHQNRFVALCEIKTKLMLIPVLYQEGTCICTEHERQCHNAPRAKMSDCCTIAPAVCCYSFFPDRSPIAGQPSILFILTVLFCSLFLLHYFDHLL